MIVHALSVPGTPESLEAIRAFVTRAATEAGLGESMVYRVTLAVDEIATNSILYAYAAQSGELHLTAEIEPERLTIFLEDTGAPFDPLAQELPTEIDIERPLNERQTGGWGIFLVLRCVDRFEYKRVGDRNRHIFYVFLETR